jgi:hypothetical protein
MTVPSLEAQWFLRRNYRRFLAGRFRKSLRRGENLRLPHMKSENGPFGSADAVNLSPTAV